MNLICSQLFDDQVGLKFEYGIFEDLKSLCSNCSLIFQLNFTLLGVCFEVIDLHLYFIFGFS